MKRIPVFIFLLVICCSSCSNQRHLALYQQRSSQLSRQLGFTIHPKEDLLFYEEIVSWLGVPYRKGGNSRQGIDCSAFVGAIYNKTYGKSIHRTVDGIYAQDIRKIGKRKLKTGDLLFFNFSSSKKRFTHTGIYLKKGYFVHASSSGGVIISHLSAPYYRKGWKKSGRVK